MAVWPFGKFSLYKQRDCPLLFIAIVNLVAKKKWIIRGCICEMLFEIQSPLNAAKHNIL